jgi:hypothetical protein
VNKIYKVGWKKLFSQFVIASELTNDDRWHHERLGISRKVVLFPLVALCVGAPAYGKTEIPSSTSTVTLQILDPNESDFYSSAGTIIDGGTVVSSNGVIGDSSKDWVVSNSGSISGTGTGIRLGNSAGNNSSSIINFGIVTNNACTTAAGNCGAIVIFGSGNNSVVNEASGQLMSSTDAIYIKGFGSVSNSGLIQSGLTGVFYANDGVFSQSGEGVVNGLYGVSADAGTVSIKNNGSISGAYRGVGGSGRIDITNETDGVISSSGGDAVRFEYNSTGSLTNNGLIEGYGNGVKYSANNKNGQLINNSSIVGGTNGIWNVGTVDNITNNENVVGRSGSSIENHGKISGGVVNSGILQGQVAGVLNNDLATISFIENSGSITGLGGG